MKAVFNLKEDSALVPKGHLSSHEKRLVVQNKSSLSLKIILYNT